MTMFAPVAPPDTAAAAAARARQDTLTKPRGALGRLEDLSVWVASCQGHCPPTQFERARIVVFAGDHGVARSGVSAYPPEVTGQMVANIAAGGAAINALADIAGATVRIVDLAVDSDPLSPHGRMDFRGFQSATSFQVLPPSEVVPNISPSLSSTIQPR